MFDKHSRKKNGYKISSGSQDIAQRRPVLQNRDITRRNMAMLTDEDIDEAGRRLCSSGADMQSRSTLGDRTLIYLPKLPVDRLYCHQSSTNWPFSPVDRQAKRAR